MFKLVKHHAKYKRGITFGAFDGLHVGHLNLLSNASILCDKLYVGVSDDRYIKFNKGNEPMFKQSSRMGALVVYAKKYFYKVFYQSLDYSKEDAVKKIKPDIIFVGSDWANKDWDGAKLGIPVIYLQRTKEISSTKLRKL